MIYIMRNRGVTDFVWIILIGNPGSIVCVSIVFEDVWLSNSMQVSFFSG